MENLRPTILLAAHGTVLLALVNLAFSNPEAMDRMAIANASSCAGVGLVAGYACLTAFARRGISQLVFLRISEICLCTLLLMWLLSLWIH